MARWSKKWWKHCSPSYPLDTKSAPLYNAGEPAFDMDTNALLPVLLAKIEREKIPEPRALLQVVMSLPLCRVETELLLRRLSWHLHAYRAVREYVPQPFPPDSRSSKVLVIPFPPHDPVADEEDTHYIRILEIVR